MSHVFISYNREDVQFALRLRDYVRALGFQTWLDVDDIPKGVYWPDAVDAGLRGADVIVGVVTPESIASRNVKNEWDWALDNDRPLLLLRLRQTTMPHRYVSLNYIDVAKDETMALASLGSALVDPSRPLYREDRSDGLREQAKFKSADARNRTRMLEKVYNFWVRGVLERSLHGAALLELGMASQPEAVEHPWGMELRHPHHDTTALPAGTRIIDAYDDLGGELLILGAPGAGKTTTLLELTRDLIARAEADPGHPIPVVFNLSSWADARRPLAAWMADELNTRYQVPRNIGKMWLEQDMVLPLLDGLDEVSLLQRDACVEAINTFRGDHGFLPLIVCSRSADYEALRARLHLQSAILLQPLTLEQIDAYFASLGPEMTAARQAVRSDSTLRELAETPLMLSILSLAYRGLESDALDSAATLDERRERLFAAYVDTMLTRRAGESAFLPQQTRRWLAWLARGMVRQGQTIFFIENLQREWFTLSERRIYIILSRLLLSLIMGLTIGLAGGLGAGIPIGLSGGAVAGLGAGIGALVSLVILGLSLGLVGGLVGGLFIGLIAAFMPPTVGGRIRWEIWGEPGIDRITVVETLRWSSSKALIGLGIGAVGGFISGVIGAAISSSLNNGASVFPAYLVLPIGAGLGMAGGLVGGLSGREVGMRTLPNQGIRRSARNGLRVGAVGGLIGLVIIALLLGLEASRNAPQNLQLLTGVAIGGGIGAAFGVVFAVAGGLFFGGLACLQHLVLRAVLTWAQHAPWKYARFLDYAAGRVFLRKVGGGYIFVHRLLLEYFAELAE